MAVRLTTGAEAEAAGRALAEADRALSAIRAHGTDADFFLDYSRWAVEQARALRSMVATPHLADLILTPRHAMLQTIGAGLRGEPEAPHLRLLTSAEIEERHAELSLAAAELRREHDSWSAAGTLVLPDTNVFLHHREKFDEIAWPALLNTDGPVTVVVPIIILRELDRQKTAGHKQKRFRAGYSLSRIDTLFDGKLIETERPELAGAGSARLRVIIGALDHRPLDRADDEIISQALTVQSWSGRPVALITFDTGMAFTARQNGLPVVKLGQADVHQEFAIPEPRR
ncbi:PIN domain-containing protein [Actinoplanes sp. NPDC026619]|uniref:PIN domain-containing protein n=1 Tax=Actinoplanes sp. NPDC026619 TaxID=3155798 RepID=UPI00340FA961